ncbi:MAG TPA: DUF6603 domain-containing protein [Vicinamibacterales bacterium]|nr:DUF6603 domain-containing protein [Vicinamibacterales bacterium]
MSAFLGEIVTGLRCALEPLETAFTNEVRLKQFLADFGWDLNVSPASMSTIRAGFALEDVFAAAKAVADQLEAENANVGALIVPFKDAVVAIVDAIKALSAAPPAGLPFPLDQPAFWAEVPAQLADHLMIRMVQSQAAPVFGILRLLGLAEITPEAPAGPGRVAYRKLVIRWDRVPRVIGDPVALFKELYDWGGAQPFEHRKLVEVLEDFFHSVRFPARLTEPSPGMLARYYAPANPSLPDVRQLSVPIFSTASPDWSTYAEVGLAIVPIPPKGSPLQAPVGFALSPLASGAVGGGGPAGPFTIFLKGGFDVDAAFGAEIRPDGLELFAAPGKTTIDAEAGFAIQPPQPLILIGDPTGFRIELGGLRAGVGVRGPLASPEVIVSVGTGRGPNPPTLALVIQTSDADGFLGKLIGSQPMKLEFGGMVIWSSASGFHFEGSGGFEISIPLHLNLTVIEIDTLNLAVRAGDAGIGLDAGIRAKAMLGPLQAVVEDFGLATRFKFWGPDGTLGKFDFALGFKPPKGVGLSLDVGVVRGGGYLFIDPDRGEYAGALELSLFQVVTIKAIGIITTKMPDGSPGFSLLIIMSVEFGTGIQLGFGFTLLAVGGLLGLNRTMNLQALADGIRSGAIESVMFPRDIIANAPKIISDLRAFFPPREGTFLIGPMVKLGWGTPTLVSLALGIIIEIPGNIAIVGILQVALPTADAALIKLQVNFIGAIEFDKKRVWFFAALFDSRVLFLTIEGEMGLLVAFGDDANFVVSVGGFHPRFSPPPLPFPSPRRIAISILNTPVARIRVEGYFAVTSNTVQFGARAELFFGLDEINVNGHVAFDALFQFSPFYFVIEVSASLSVNVFGAGLFSVSIRGSLEGPAPWHIEGHGSISILFFDIGVDFSETWGENKKEELPPIGVLPLIQAELDKADNWRAFLPQGSSLLVSLRKMPEAEAALILHPVGVLRVSQRALPLDLKLDKVGSRKPSDVNRLSLAVLGGGLAKKAEAFDQFAPAQFQNFSDADKLSRPAFAPEHSGLDLSAGGSDLRSSKMVRRVVRYEEIIIDSNFKRFQRRFTGFMGALFNFFLNGAAVTKSELSKAARTRLQPFDDKITVQPDAYTVALQSTNQAFSAEAASFHSEASARDFMARKVAADPSLGDQLHVIPSVEKAA